MAGPSPVQGVTGLYDPTPEATAEEIWGGPADPAHGGGRDPSTGYIETQFYGGPHGPYGLDNQLLGVDMAVVYTEGAGLIGDDPRADLQPQTHAAPWPKGLSDRQSVQPDDVTDGIRESFLIHSMDQGMKRQFDAMEAKNDTWQDVDYTDPGTPTLQAQVPKQVGAVAGLRGSTDRVQSLQLQNEHGFDSAHVHRRYATGNIPGNFQWMIPGSRPLRHDRMGAIPNIPTGEDSPFTGDDVGQSFSTQGAVLEVLPTEYQEPVTPSLSPGQLLLANAAPSGVELF
jgi:hypothetical protein